MSAIELRKQDRHGPQEAGVPLDPASWDDLRSLGHKMVEDMLWHMKTVRDRPVWQPVPDDVRGRLDAPLTPGGVGERRAYDDFMRDVLPYGIGNLHPRFWGWVIGSGTPLGALAELLAGTMDQNVSGINGAPVLVELQTLTWLKELLGYPASASGLFTSGGSVANLIGLAVALSRRAGFDVLTHGLARAPKPPVIYATTQTHFSVAKSARTLGIGTAGVRVLPVTADYGMDVDALREAVREDRARGLAPVAVVASAGTTNTGAFDDLNALADFTGAEELWLHVDGAFGAFAALVPELRPLTAGMERADSLAFDLHKWLLAPIEAGVVLVKDAAAHEHAFSSNAGYVDGLPGGLARYDHSFHTFGPQLTRGFKALKVWLTLKAYGIEPFADVVRRNVEQARHLAGLVDRHGALELMAPVPLNVVCFRYTGDRPTGGHGGTDLDDLNKRILVELQEQGIAAPTSTVLNGQFVLRVCITNHRTRMDDLDLLVRETVRLGRELSRT